LPTNPTTISHLNFHPQPTPNRQSSISFALNHTPTHIYTYI
jgi:hypothetical protein